MSSNEFRKKDSSRLTWDTKPRRAPNPKDIEFQTAEVVIPNPQKVGQLPLSFQDGLFGEEEIDKQNLMQSLEQNYLDKHDAVQRSAGALLQNGIPVLAAPSLHYH